MLIVSRIELQLRVNTLRDNCNPIITNVQAEAYIPDDALNYLNSNGLSFC